MKLTRSELWAWFNSTDTQDQKIVQYILDLQDELEQLKEDFKL